MIRVHVFGVVAIVSFSCVVLAAQQPAGRGEGPGRIGGSGIGAYPARPPAEPAALDRGRAVYGTNCTFCHGADTRGGDGGPSLLRSSLVLDDKQGELIGPVILAGRPDRGMPKFALTAEQIADIATFLHSFRVAGYDSSRNQPTTSLRGGRAFGGRALACLCCGMRSPSLGRRSAAPSATQRAGVSMPLLPPHSSLCCGHASLRAARNG